MEKFKNMIENKYKLHFSNYWEFHKWTVDNFPSFWEEVWNHFGMVFSKPYDKAFEKTGPGFLDNKWFTGCKFNYAENYLKIRDNREALICLDEEGHLERVTFAELFEEVKLYAAAFRKQGLRIGDRVACYMSNRKEAVFAMLATTSIGAICGGPQPYLGPRAAAKIIQNLDAKFLIVVDSVRDECSAEEYNLLENLPMIAECSPTLERIIIVPTKKETLQMDISHIPKSCLLCDFLATGFNRDGTVPDIVFEQLPFDHPTFISFTSGTTGPPKGSIHASGSLLGPMVDLGLHYNLKSGDTIFLFYAMGWLVWNYMLAGLSLGVRIFLYDGSTYSTRDGKNMWDLFSEHRVSFAYVDTTIVDTMEKMNLGPRSDANFDNLQFVMTGGSPVKLQNYRYLKNMLKHNVFVGNLYGTTESFGIISGVDLNTPCHAPEAQVPALGRDVHVYDKNGRSVIGERGELVITNRSPTFLVGLWKDTNREMLNQTYFSKYIDIWRQHDTAYINPRTKGLVILGRSDDTIIQSGQRLGCSDIYFAIHDMAEIADYICVAQKKSSGDSRAVLFLQLKPTHPLLTPELKEKVAKKIEDELWVYCVPEVILQIKAIPYNANNKRVESLIRKIVTTNRIPDEVNIRNPECLKDYCNIPELMNYDDDSACKEDLEN